jgi:RNA polymerase sigma factor (TIGR02999 family)
MAEITQLLARARSGEPERLAEVFAVLYPELRRLARSRLATAEATLTPTVLVHEAFLRLTGSGSLSLNDRQHFFACAARAMRQILVDRARARGAWKRGAGLDLDALMQADGVVSNEPELLDIDAALDRVDAIDPGLRELIEMRVFAGLTLEELAASSERSLRTINRDWQRARAMLLAQLD